MRRDGPWDEPLYRAFEEIDGQLEPRMVGSYDGDHIVKWNAKKRLYTDLTTARTYKKRLAKEGRKVRIFRYVQESEVD